MTTHSIVNSPIGALTVIERGGVLCALGFPSQRAALLARYASRLSHVPTPAVAALTAYFAGEVDALEDLQVAADGTPFQQRVWAALRRIPFGRTATYSEIARTIGAARAVRAVGAANRQNPVAVVIPCHRVIGADGSLTGYAGGLPRKEWLLNHERALR
jgi:methylated-DNA-[protein]-cysteine S-methyltransferase